MAEGWQKKLRYRGFRLLFWSLPVLILSLVATSLIPRRPPLLLAAGKITHVRPGSGRLVLPQGIEGPIPVLLELQWPRRPPRGLMIELLIRDPGDQNRQEQKIPVKAKSGLGNLWRQTLSLAVVASPVQDYRLSITGEAAAVSTDYRLTAFAGMPWAKLLRIGEMLNYPAMALTLLAISMILFPRFMS